MHFVLAVVDSFWLHKYNTAHVDDDANGKFVRYVIVLEPLGVTILRLKQMMG